MSQIDDEVRRALERMADEVPRRGPMPRRVSRGGRFRAVRNGVVVLAMVALLAGGGFAGFRALGGDGVPAVTPTSLPPTAPSPTPTGSTIRELPVAENGVIAFSLRLDGNEEIYVVEPEGSGLTRLTVDPAADRSPSWSPDGSRIVFSRTTSEGSDLWVMDADGANQVPLATAEEDETEPAWSPDGSTIAYTQRTGGGSSAIALMDADGDRRRSLAIGLPNGHSPTWAPDGSRLVFDAGAQLYSVSPGGDDLRALGGGRTADWCPDGEPLVYAREPSGSGGEQALDLWLVSPDGHDPQPLTHDGGSFDPEWSPDGNLIAFARLTPAGDTSHIWLIEVGYEPQRVTTGPGLAEDPAWQPIPVE